MTTNTIKILRLIIATISAFGFLMIRYPELIDEIFFIITTPNGIWTSPELVSWYPNFFIAEQCTQFGGCANAFVSIPIIIMDIILWLVTNAVIWYIFKIIKQINSPASRKDSL